MSYELQIFSKLRLIPQIRYTMDLNEEIFPNKMYHYADREFYFIRQSPIVRSTTKRIQKF